VLLAPKFPEKREEALKLHARPCPGAGVDLDREREKDPCHSWANGDWRLLSLDFFSMECFTQSKHTTRDVRPLYDFIQPSYDLEINKSSGEWMYYPVCILVNWYLLAIPLWIYSNVKHQWRRIY
jgi:hypothetical protein